METAIHADKSVLSAFEKLKAKPEIQHSQNETDQLKLLAKDEGFKALQVVIDRQIDQLNEMRLKDNEGLEAIGFRFLACQVAIEQLRFIRNLPEALAKGGYERSTRAV